jgi:NAD(P)-dependent dehydrogenase (short-subunit alcohol dehydrogenase family)
MPLARYGQPEEIAAVAAFLAAPESSFVTGHVYPADGGFTVAGIMEG